MANQQVQIALQNLPELCLLEIFALLDIRDLWSLGKAFFVLGNLMLTSRVWARIRELNLHTWPIFTPAQMHDMIKFTGTHLETLIIPVSSDRNVTIPAFYSTSLKKFDVRLNPAIASQIVPDVCRIIANMMSLFTLRTLKINGIPPNFIWNSFNERHTFLESVEVRGIAARVNEICLKFYKFRNLRRLAISHLEFTAKSLPGIERQQNLTHFFIGGGEMHMSLIRRIAQCQRIRTLGFAHMTSLTKSHLLVLLQGCQLIEKLSLLNLLHCGLLVDGDVLRAIVRLQNLQELTLKKLNMSVDAHALDQLSVRRILTIEDCTTVEGWMVITIVGNSPELQFVKVEPLVGDYSFIQDINTCIIHQALRNTPMILHVYEYQREWIQSQNFSPNLRFQFE